MTTFLAPAARCFAAPSRFVKSPVDSNTTSTPRSFHGSCAGSRSDSTLNSSLSTEIASLLASTFACRLPSTESYFSRCASVAAFVRSLTATKSMFLAASAARMILRPMRPNPLMPTLTDIHTLQQIEGTQIKAARGLISDKGNSVVNALAEGQTRTLYSRVAKHQSARHFPYFQSGMYLVYSLLTFLVFVIV